MPPDIEKYRKHVDRFDLSEDQKIELIHMVWRIMESFVDRAFGLDPVQQVTAAHGSKDALEGPRVLEFQKNLQPCEALQRTFRAKPKKDNKRKK